MSHLKELNDIISSIIPKEFAIKIWHDQQGPYTDFSALAFSHYEYLKSLVYRNNPALMRFKQLLRTFFLKLRADYKPKNMRICEERVEGIWMDVFSISKLR